MARVFQRKVVSGKFQSHGSLRVSQINRIDLGFSQLSFINLRSSQLSSNLRFSQLNLFRSQVSQFQCFCSICHVSLPFFSLAVYLPNKIRYNL